MAVAEQLRHGETKTARERGRKGVRCARNFSANLGNKLTVMEGRPIQLGDAGSSRWDPGGGAKLARGEGSAGQGVG